MAKAVVVRETGGPEVLRLDDHDPGPPRRGEVRVKVHVAGVNFIDVYHRTGLYGRDLPFIPGQEGSGTVEQAGEDAGAFSTGDRVAWASVPGSYADLLNAPVERLVRVPADLALDLAAAAMLQGMTAHYLAHATHETQPGDTALVHAAAGGVGLLLVQMLKRAGARVLGTCSTAEKAALVRDAGADHVILYTHEDFSAEVRQLTDGRGVDVVYDSVGRSSFEGSLRSLRRRGLLVLFGQSSGPVPPFDLRRLNDFGSLFVTRPNLAHYTADRAELELRANEVM
jgi:NADPH:quinone reductase